MKYFYLQWHITNECQNKCKHCYQKDYSKQEIQIDNAKKIVDDLIKCSQIMNVEPKVSITGGDPLLSKNFFDIAYNLKRYNIKFSILGNPELLLSNNIYYDKLKDLNLDFYQLSLDGNVLIHDKLRYEGSFKKTTQAIKELVEKGIKVNILSTITRLNYDTIFEVMDLSYSLGANHWDFSRYVGENKICDIPSREYFYFLKRLNNKHKKYENIGKHPLSKEPLLAVLKEAPKNEVICGGCSIGSACLSILPDNTIMACRRHYGSVLGKWSEKKTFIDFIINDDKMELYRSINKIDKCNKCKYLYACRGCRAIAYISSKSQMGIDPQCPIII